MSGYTISTWFFANLLYPVIFFFLMGGGGNEVLSGLALFLPFLFITILLSLPSLLLSFIVMHVLVRFKIPADGKFILWLVIAPCLVVANYLLLHYYLLKEESINNESWFIISPAIIAVTGVILIRFKSFYISINGLQNNQMLRGEERI